MNQLTHGEQQDVNAVMTVAKLWRLGGEYRELLTDVLALPNIPTTLRRRIQQALAK